MRTRTTTALLVAACAMLPCSGAHAFGGLAETMGATGVQGVLAGSATTGASGAIGSVRSRVNSAVSTHNRALFSALGASAPQNAGSPATWMTAASGIVHTGGEGWATLTGGPNGSAGWKGYEAFGGGAQQGWPSAQDAWATGGILPR